MPAKGLSAYHEAMHAEAQERRRKALELRKQTFTYEEIGRMLDISKQRAHKLVKEALAELQNEINETAEDVRQLELERLDRMFMRLWRTAMPSTGGQAGAEPETNHKVIETMLKIMDRRAKLLGLDAPTRHEVLTIDKIDQEIERLEAELATR